MLDGDDIRGQDKEKLGFGHDDVLKNNLRIAYLCQKLREEYDAIVVPVIIIGIIFLIKKKRFYNYIL